MAAAEARSFAKMRRFTSRSKGLTLLKLIWVVAFMPCFMWGALSNEQGPAERSEEPAKESLRVVEMQVFNSIPYFNTAKLAVQWRSSWWCSGQGAHDGARGSVALWWWSGGGTRGGGRDRWGHNCAWRHFPCAVWGSSQLLLRKAVPISRWLSFPLSFIEFRRMILRL